MLKRDVVKDQRRRMNSKNLIQGVQRKGNETSHTRPPKTATVHEDKKL